MKKLRILIADDHALVRQGLRSVLETQPGWTVCGEAENGREAVKLGYERAWSAIRDSNISTFAAGLILFQFGTGPVKGFAVTLCVGVLTGLFSCIVVTRAWYDYKIQMRKLAAISV